MARVVYPNGLWDQLRVTFYFRRRYGFFVLQAYVPTYMVIFVAWINFWMDPRELGTRATLAISAFLAMSLQFGNVISNMPRVSYIKAIDVWMIGGILFLFLCLAELAVISYMLRSDKPQRRSKVKVNHQHKDKVSIQLIRNQSSPPIQTTNAAAALQRPHAKLFKRWTPYEVDRMCLYAFPILFMLFNAVYWASFIKH